MRSIFLGRRGTREVGASVVEEASKWSWRSVDFGNGDGDVERSCEKGQTNQTPPPVPTLPQFQKKKCTG